MIIGERLKGYLKSHRISAKSFAEMVGVTEGMVYKYYKMDSIDSQTIKKWAEMLHIPIMTFMDDEMYEKATHKTTEEELIRAEEYYNKNKEYINFKNRRIFGDLANTPKDVVAKEFEEIESRNQESQNNSVSMSREVFEQISRLTETILSQQRTIESMQEQIKKMLAQTGSVAICASASGFELGK